MKRCEKCGVQFSGDLDRCPLCQAELSGDASPAPKRRAAPMPGGKSFKRKP